MRIIILIGCALSLSLLLVSTAEADDIIAVQSGDWSDPATWQGGVVPGAGNTAVTGGFSLTLDANFTVGGLEFDPNGELLGTNSVLTIAGNSTLGSTSNSGYEYLVPSSGSQTITITNQGAANVYTLPGQQYGLNDANDGTAVWDNQAGGNFTLNDSASIAGSHSSLFINEAGATFTKAGANTSVVDWDITNNGTLAVQQGTLEANGLNYNGTGTAVVASGAVLQLNSLTIGDGVTVTGNGTTLLTGQSSLAGATQLNNADLQGTLSGAGNLTVNGNFAWEAGTDIHNVSDITLYGTTTLGSTINSGYEFLYNNQSSTTRADNYGNVSVLAPAGEAYGLYDDNYGATVWENHAGSNFTLNDAATIYGSPHSLFVNDAGAAFTKTGANTSLVDWDITNNGTLAVQQGTLEANGLNYNGTGTTQVASGAVLQLNSLTVGDGVVVTGNGTTLLTGSSSLAGATQLNNADLQGTLTGAGNLTVNGNFAWEANADIHNVSGVTFNGTTTLGSTINSGYEFLYNSQSGTTRADNYGNVSVLAQAGDQYGLYDDGYGATVWENHAGSNFTLNDAASIGGSYNSLFINDAGAEFTKAGANTSVEDWSFTNNGDISVQSGTLQFSNGITYNGTGTVEVANGAGLVFTGVTLGDNTTINGNGTVTLQNTETIAGAVKLNNVDLQNQITGAGNLTTAGNFTWEPGTFIYNLGGLTLNGTSTLGSTVNNGYEYLYNTNGGTMRTDNYGNVSVLAPPGNQYGLYDDNYGTTVWENHAGSNFTLNDAATVLGNSRSQFINDAGAEFTKAGANTSLEDWSFTNNGDIAVQAGNLSFTGITYNGTGTVEVANGAELQFSGVTIGSGTAISGNGVVTLAGSETLTGAVQLRNADLQQYLTGAGNLTTTGNFTWEPGAFIYNLGGLTLNGTTTIGVMNSSGYEYLYNTVGGTMRADNYGNASVQTVPGQQYGLYDNTYGTTVWENHAGSSFTLNDSATIQGSANSQFINDAGATFTKAGGNISAVQWGFSNNGTVEVQNGTLGFAANVAQNDAANSTLTGGTWKVDNNAELDFPGTPQYTTNNGTIILSGANSTFAPANPVTNNNGGFQLLAGRSFTVTPSADFINEGSVVVDGANSSLNISGTLYNGYNGTGTLTVSNGGSMTSNAGYLGYNSGANGTVLVTGAGSTWNNAAELDVGEFGNGTLTVSSGGNVSSAEGVVGTDTGSTGTATVTGANAVWNINNYLDVGYYGMGNLTISNGGNVTDASAYLGNNPGSNGMVTVTGANSTWNTGGVLYVGNNGGNGTLNVADGGYVDVAGNDSASVGMYVGNPAGSTGNVTVSGVDEISGNSSGLEVGTGALVVGNAGQGTLNVTDGGYVEIDGNDSAGVGMYVGNQTGSNANVTVSGVDAASGYSSNLFIDTGALVVGNAGNGTLTVSSGGFVDAGGNDTAGVGLYLGKQAGSTGNLTVSGVDAASDEESELNIDTGALVVGNAGNGTLSITGGGAVFAEGNDSAGVGVYIGNEVGSVGNVTISGVGEISGYYFGSDLQVGDGIPGEGALVVGNAGQGTLNIASGGIVYAVGNDTAGVGMYVGNQTGSIGNVTVSDLDEISGNYYSSGLDVREGALVVGNAGQGSLSITDGGGVSVDWSDTAGVGMYVGNQTGSTGNVTVSGPDAILGNYYGSELGVDEGALVVGNAGNGTLTVSSGGFVAAGGNDSAGVGMYVGNQTGSIGNVTVSGVGNFSGNYYNSELQVGAGALVVGNHGNGTLNITDGGVVYAEGNDSAGVSLYIGKQAGSTGNVTVSGVDAASSYSSTMFIENGALVVGNSGNGTLTVSSAGFVSVVGGNLVLANNVNSNGTLNLNSGGILQVGGANGIRAGAGTYAFNWGGGTVEVNGSDLTTSINATLVPDATPSTLDTNGLNATWSGVISGNDSFSKTGAGTLTLTANNTYSGITSVSGGTLQIGAGGTSGTLGSSNVTDNASLAFDRADNYTYPGVIPGSGNVSQIGSGTLTLNGNNTYGGNTTVDGGTLAVSGVGASIGGNYLIVGAAGTGNLTISNGGNVTNSGWGYIGQNAGSNGTATVSGSNSTWTTSLNILVGYNGAGNLTISNGGDVTVGASTSIGQSPGSVGVVTVTGANSTLKSGNVDVGTFGNGTLTISNGGNVASGGSMIGYDSTGAALVTGTNSIWNLYGDSLTVGDQPAGKGTLTISSGGLVATGGGTVFLAYEANSNGTINLTSGGTLQVGGTNGLQAGNGNYAFNWGGGTVQVIGSDLTASVNATLGSGTTSTMNTNGLNATWSGVLSGAGALDEVGAGTLTLSGNNTYTGGTTVNGALSISSNTALGIGGAATLLNGSSLTVTNAPQSLANNIIIPAAATANLTFSDNVSVSYSGAIVSSSNSVLNLFSVANPLTLSGTTAQFTNFAGTLNFPAGLLRITLNGPTNFSSATVNLGSTASFYTRNSATISVGALTGVAGSLVYGASNDTGTTTWQIGSLGTNDIFAGNITNNGAEGLSALDKVGPGNLTLTGHNTYTGGTTVDNGTLVVNGGVIASGGASLTVGNVGGDNGTFTIQNGGNVTSGTNFVGQSSGSSGTVTVTGANSSLSTTFFEVGNNGAGSLTISSGGSVISSNTGFLADRIGSSGNVTVDGTNSTWNLGANQLYVGFNGTGNLAISNGGNVTSGYGGVGYNPGMTGNVLVTGTNSTWNVTGSSFLTVGYEGTANLTIASGGVINSGDGDVGGNTGSIGTALVTGANSSWNIASTLLVGDAGTGNLTISNGGHVTSGNGYLGNVNTGNGTLTVTGTNSTWNLGSNQLCVGFNGLGNLAISSGGNVTSGYGVVGTYSGGNGTALVTGTNSTWTMSGGTLFVGDYVPGNLTISNSGAINSEGGDVGTNAGGNGTVLVTGTNSTWNISNGLYVGDGGAGNLTITNGGTITSGFGDVGTNVGGNGTALVTGTISTWNMASTLFVGDSGRGNLTIASGGQVTSASGYLGNFNSGNGTVTVTGANSTWNLGDTPLFIGYNGTGNLTISSGGNVTSTRPNPVVTSAVAFLGYNSGANGTVTVTGANSTWNIGGPLFVGWNGTGNLTIANGGLVGLSLGGAEVGSNAGSNGTVLVTGVNSTLNASLLTVGGGGNGSLTIASGGTVASGGNITLAQSSGSNGTINLNSGGALQVGNTSGIQAGSGTYAFNWGGGTMQVIGSDLTTSINATLVPDATASTLNTNGFNATWSGALSGNGSLDKIGLGTLTLTANNTYGGGTTVNNGTLVLNGGGISHGGANLTVGNLSGDNAFFVVQNGGKVSDNQGILGNNAGANGTATVTGTNTTWNNGGALFVGGLGNGTLTVSNGGQVSAAVATVIGDGIGTNGTVTVTGASTTLLPGTLEVGLSGNGNLTISNGGTVTSTGQEIGTYETGSNGTVTVTGANSTWNSGGGLTVGGGGNGTLLVSAGGLVASGQGTIGSIAGATATATVTGANSTWNSSVGLTVGVFNNGSLTISNGGLVTIGGGNLVLASSSGSTGTINLNSGGALQVGGTNGIQAGAGNYAFNWGGGTVQVIGSDLTTSINATLVTDATQSTLNTNGFNATWSGGLSGNGSLDKIGLGTATLTGNNIYTGTTTVDGGTLAVSGAGAAISAASGLTVGNNGTANLTVAGGGAVSSSNYASVALNSGSNGMVSVTGTNSTLTVPGMTVGNSGNGSVVVGGGGLVSAGAQGLAVGFNNGSSGALTVSSGGNLTTSGNINLAPNTGSNGTASVSGANAVLAANGLTVGGSGNGSLTVSSGGNVSTVNFTVLAFNGGSNGAASVTGANATLATNLLTVGNNGNGTLTVSSGGNVTTASSTVLGLFSGSNGTISVTGGNSVLNTGGLVVGSSGNGNLTIASGGMLTLTSNAVTLGLNSGGNGVLNLNAGGTLQTGNVQAGNGTYAFNWGGGTVQVAGSNLTTAINATLVPDTAPSTLNTNGFSTTWSGVISGNNSFSKTGAGTLTFTGNNTYAGTTSILNGTLKIGVRGTSGSLGSGDVIDNATLTFDRMDSYTYGGVISGTGIVNQIGNGTMILTGANTYAGTTSVSNGTLQIGAGGASGSLGPGNVSDTANLTFDLANSYTYGGVISGSGTLGQIGNGTTNLTGSNTYSGNTTVSAGTLNLGVTGAALKGNEVIVGVSGAGNLTVSAGGKVTNNGDSYLGLNAGSNGTVTVTGTNSKWNNGGTLFIGENGMGNLMVSAGGNVTSVYGIVGDNTTANGMVTVTGANSKWNLQNTTLYVGEGGNGTVNITSGGNVSSEVGEVGYMAGSNGAVTVDGANSTWNLENSFLFIGDTGNGTLTVSNGGQVLGDVAELAREPGSTGTVTVSGANSTLVNTSNLIDLVIGNLGSGILTVSSGGLVTTGLALNISAYSGSSGVVNLNSGGTIQAGNTSGIQTGTGNYAFNWGGGTVQVTGSDLTTSINATLMPDATPSTLDTNGFNATWSGVISGNDSFSKIGAGTLTLAGANTFSALVTIVNGTLAVSGPGTLGNTTNTVDVFSGATLNIAGSSSGVGVGTLTDNGSVALGANLTVGSDYTNPNFGSGNSFNGRAGVTGTGLILAGGNSALGVTGNVTGGNTATPVLALPNIHQGGNETLDYAVVNTGTNGPVLRGALQTNVNGGHLTDARLSGTGVTASNYVPLAPGNSTSAYAVTLTGSSAGALAANQTVAIVSNYGNVGPQKLQITGGNVYAYAAAGNLATPLNLGNFHVGDTAQQTVPATNAAGASGGFTENLGGSATGSSGNATGSGSFNGLATGNSSTALTASLNTASAGAKSGNVTYGFVSQALAGSGLGNTTLASQTVALSGNVYLLAAASNVTTSVNFFNLHVGDLAQTALPVTNDAPGTGGFTELLDAFLNGIFGDAVGSGSFSNLASGGTSNALEVGVNTSVAGAKAGNVTFNFTSSQVNNSGLGNTTLAAQTVGIQADVYALAAASVLPANLTLGNYHVGDTATQALSVTNAAPDTGGYTENLGGGFTGTSGNATGSGSFNGLGVGGSSNALVAGLSTAQAGPVSGNVTYSFASQAIASGLSNTTLPTQTVGLSATVYRLAAANTLPQSVNLGIVHVGDTVITNLMVLNTAGNTGGYTENLNAAFGAVSSSLSGNGTIAGLGPNDPASNALMVALNTTTAGVVSGATAQVNFFSSAINGSGLGNTTLPTQTVTFAAQINNYANPAWSLESGNATLIEDSPTVVVLDFGNVALNTGNGTEQVEVSLANNIANPADWLNGNFSSSNPSGQFAFGGLNDFVQMLPGNSTTIMIDFSTVQQGDFTANITLAAISQNSGGFSGSLGGYNLEIEAAVPEPSFAGLAVASVALLAAWRRHR
jgi:T5SS/PEP-CTERM-associated repeat protein/autotransporter-associated beta strand protein